MKSKIYELQKLLIINVSNVMVPQRIILYDSRKQLI